MALLLSMCENLPATDSDVVIIGAGMAGWTAARRAQQLGLHVLIVDKGAEAPGACNARVSGGMIHACYLSVREDPEFVIDYALEISDGRAERSLVNAWARNCARAVDWLVEEGIEFTAASHSPGQPAYLSPMQDSPRGLQRFERERGPDRALTLLAEAFVRGGGRFMGSTRAHELVLDKSGAVCGVICKRDDGMCLLRAKAVVIADGGFQANKEMLVRYVGPRADEMLLRSLSTQTGDGIRMGLEIGAKAVNMNFVYGHMVSLDALRNPDLWPYPVLDSLIERGILVNARGERFVDERISGEGLSKVAMSGIGVTNAVAKSLSPRDAIAIFDHGTWSDAELGYLKTLPANPYLTDHDATVHIAETFDELAEKAGIRAEGLRTTVEAFNAAASAGETRGLRVPRSGSPRPIESAPFFAVPCVGAITFTMGGLLVSARGQVLDLDNEPISGLYAAGGAMGGLQGGPRGGYMGGLSEALVFGLLSAEHIAHVHGGVVPVAESR